MDTTITRPSDPSESPAPFDATPVWPTHHDQTLLLAMLRQATAQSRTLGRAIVASYTRAIPVPDPIAIYIATGRLGVADACYWQQPSANRAFVGVGAASIISGQGAGSLAAASADWRAMLRDAVVATAGADGERLGQPRCYGGFAFDPLSPRTSLWEGFPMRCWSCHRSW